MPKSQTQNAKIAAAALRLAAARGWENVTFDALAKAAKISPAILKKHFASPNDIIPVVIEEITRETLASAGKTRGSPRDVMFDLLMSRFDVLQKNRKAVLSITETARRDHSLACVLARAVLKSIGTTIDAAKIETPPRSVLIAGASAVYAWAFLAWRRDKTRDMSKTMAALDRALRLAGKISELVIQNS
jgi:AcrR family transcriptional regulator